GQQGQAEHAARGAVAGNGDVAMREAGQVGHRQTGVALQAQRDVAQAAQVRGRDGGAPAECAQSVDAALGDGAAEAGQPGQVDPAAAERLEDAVARRDGGYLRQVHGGAVEGLKDDVVAVAGVAGAAPGGHAGQVEQAVGPVHPQPYGLVEVQLVD